MPFDPVAYGATPLTVSHPSIQALARSHVEREPRHYGRGKAAVQREAERLLDLWRESWAHHLIQADVDALVDGERLWDYTRTPRDAGQAFVAAIKSGWHDENSWLPEASGYRPTADEVNAWSIGGLGHDSINASICIEARCKRAGVPVECARCDGEGSLWPTREIRQQCEDWEPTEPPTGPGYQLWSTTSEGEPITPVCRSLGELARHAAVHCTTFGTSNRATAEEWERMLEADRVVHREGNNIFS